MGKKRMTKILSLLLVMFTTMSITAFASSNKTYYAKAAATAVGNGKVYIGKNKTAPAEEDYLESAENTNSVSSGSSPANVSLYLFAQPGANNIKFEGWFENAECTDTVSTDNPYLARISSNATTEANAVLKTYYAKFVEASVFYSSTLTATVVGENGQISVATDAETENYNAENSSDSILNNVQETHNYYLKAQVEDPETYRFAGWYSDAACENQISKNATYTYAVTAESTDESNPTAVEVYAKFEVIPCYYSSINATAVGDGKVYVNTKNTTTEDEWATESDADQVIADKAEHTYYLFAQAENEDIEFDGWFADEECTEFLSAASPYYSYKVTSESQDPEEVSSFNVYAKFSARNYYQVRNGGFEKWAKENEPGYGWNSFQSAAGSMAATGKGMSPNPEKVEGRNGGSAVRIFSKYAGMLGIGANANGNLTTGIVNMGSMTPTDASNHNYSNVADPVHSLFIAGQPDGVEFYTKYKKGEEGEYLGHANFIIHDEYNYRDPEVEEELEHKIGECGAFIEESEEWVRNYAAFEYIWEKDSADIADKYLLINFTTNMTPGGSVRDTLIIDDVRLIYNSELATATYDGNEITFNEGEATIDTLYNDQAVLALTSNGRGATIETSYDPAVAILTITVKGQDFSENPENIHIYTIQFKKSEPIEVAIEEGEGTLTVTSTSETAALYYICKPMTYLDEGETPESLFLSDIQGMGTMIDSEETWEMYDHMGMEPAPKTFTIADYQEMYGGQEMFLIAANIGWDGEKLYVISNIAVENFTVPTPVAIQNVATQKVDNGATYNLSGQRVNANTKGIVIKGGKKYVVK